MLNEKISDLRFKLSEESLQLLPEYHQKLDVRREREREREGRGERKGKREYLYILQFSLRRSSNILVSLSKWVVQSTSKDEWLVKYTLMRSSLLNYCSGTF